MRILIPAILASLILAVSACSAPSGGDGLSNSGFESYVANKELHEGFFDVYTDKDGDVYALLPAPEEDGTMLRLIHAMRLTSGLGSNPVGLDRGWGNSGEIVRFRMADGKVIAEIENHRYRATADSPLEQRAVEQSFASSYIWSGNVVAKTKEGEMLIDLSGFLKKDLLGLARAMEEDGAGFSLDNTLSFAEAGSVLAFPDNIEVDAKLTFTSANPGPEVQQTAAYANAVTLTVHHSFVRLPDDGYTPRMADQRTGTFALGFYDYSAPLEGQVLQAYAMRHRLVREEPGNPDSPFVDPIVFYVDPGAPPEIRDALVEGAGWWAEAFDAAGLKGAYRVEVLPEDANPLDIRYNIVQWVHRQTRGWSYGGGIIDPRTGEFIKGHVILGSQRVRQDRMIFEGLAGAGKSGTGEADDPVELSLARIRQLAAHEVAHALGFGHNFAASVSDRASVADYPAPWVTVAEDGTLDFSKVYDTGIGEWDKATVAWLYGEFDPAEEETALNRLVADARQDGLLYISDEHGRGAGTMHPYASVWDNGSDPVAELENVMEVRRIALDGFGTDVLADGREQSALAEVFVPVWLYHRYQLAAAAKLIGGASYQYAKSGVDTADIEIVPAAEQRHALQVVLTALSPEALTVPEDIAGLMQPATDPYWFRVPSERMESRAGPAFDTVAATETAADLALSILFHPARAERLVQFSARQPGLPSLEDVLVETDRTVFAPTAGPRMTQTAQTIRGRYVFALMDLADGDVSQGVKAVVREHLAGLQRRLSAQGRLPVVSAAHDAWLAEEISAWLDRPAQPRALTSAPLDTPPGSPIGGMMGAMEECWHCDSVLHAH